MAPPSFLSEFSQKIDSKGRMSIPVDFRRVLDENDPNRPANKISRMYIIYGPHLKDHLDAFTPRAMDEIVRRAGELPLGSKRRNGINFFVVSKAQEVEIDKDGRIVMPKDRRQQLGLDDGAGMIHMLGMVDFFQIWNKKVYDEKEAEIAASFMMGGGEDVFDPLNYLNEDYEI